MPDTWSHRRLCRVLALSVVSLVLAVSTPSTAAVVVSVAIAPPPLPVYAQPVAPGPGYIWTPGYWAYGPGGYYWVPGTWVLAPFIGALWTPGYWGWGNGVYLWHPGYWGTHVGYYGGINYGFGYFGVGFHGGYWSGDSYYYNRAVTNVNVTNVHNTYVTNVANNRTTRVSYNGGPGGITRQPNAAEHRYESERRIEPNEVQLHHEQMAAGNQAMFASVNHGRPSIAATPEAGAFQHPNVVAASGEHGPSNVRHGQSAPNMAPGHAADAAPHQGRSHGEIDVTLELAKQKQTSTQEAIPS